MIERGGFEALDACVHCGFCLQACPTFLATGDEADSPRGRIELMRALEAGELGPEDRFLTLHLDRCLGCRGCEPVCPSRAPSVLLFRGCIMDGLFAHVHAATIRTLAVNGYEVREVAGQVCCGALHAHTGLRDEARRLASANVLAFGEGEEPIVVNSAGCGAILKDYGHLVGDARAHALAARVRCVPELLADRGPRRGAPADW